MASIGEKLNEAIKRLEVVIKRYLSCCKCDCPEFPEHLIESKLDHVTELTSHIDSLRCFVKNHDPTLVEQFYEGLALVVEAIEKESVAVEKALTVK